MPESEYGTIPYEIDEITSWLEDWLNDNLQDKINNAIGDLGAVYVFYSEPIAFVINGSTNNRTLGSVIIPDLDLGIVNHAKAGIEGWFFNIYNGSNALDVDQWIQTDVSGGSSWLNSIKFLDNSMEIGAYHVGKYFRAVGHVDISSKVDWNQTTIFRWASSKAEQNSFEFYGRSFIEIIV